MKSKKLTLFVPEKVIRLAKHFAALNGTSVSALVTSFFENINMESRRSSESSDSTVSLSTAAATSESIGMVKLGRSTKTDLLSDAIGSKYK